MRFSGIQLLQCCSERRSSCSEHSNLQQLSVDEGNWKERLWAGPDAKCPGCPENQICGGDRRWSSENSMAVKKKKKRRQKNRHNQNSCLGYGAYTVHPPLQRSSNIDGFLVKAAAALTNPAVVSQELSPFLHLLQNLLPFFLNLGQRLSFSFPLITCTNQSLRRG